MFTEVSVLITFHYSEVWLATGRLVISVFRFVRRSYKPATNVLTCNQALAGLLYLMLQVRLLLPVAFSYYFPSISKRRITTRRQAARLGTNARPAFPFANTMEVRSGHAAAPSDGTPGSEEPAVVKTNQHTKLGPGVPVSPLPS